MSVGKCKDGVDLPGWGACPECGATPEDECRGRGHLKRMAEVQERLNAPFKDEPSKEPYKDRRKP